MISPDKVAFYASQKEDENYKFRSYLKVHADEEELDQQFQKLHEEIFSEYDCNQCRNCCKKYRASIPEEDINKDASYIGMEADEFIDSYLKYNSEECTYDTKKCPCDFLDGKTGECLLGDCKPENCKKYPYTDQPDRMGSLFNIIDSASVCPVVYEILERLKKEYNFRRITAKKIYPNAPCPCGSGKKYKQCCGRHR